MGAHQSTFEARVEWLIRHHDLWRSWPGLGIDRAIESGMKRDGLISDGTHNIIDFAKLIAEARWQIRHGKHGGKI